MPLTEILDSALRTLAWPVGLGILANGLEELLIDVQYFARGLGRRERRLVTVEQLRAAPRRRIAILVPAWKEAEVIEQMLEHNLRTLDYDKADYDIFVGTYVNDPETQARVEAVARRAPNVHKVVVPNPGPTSKADCLNWVWQGILLEEERRGRRFDILLMHDAEDVIHPLSLRLYAMLLPEHEFVQTPVFSLELPKRKLVGATYIDEFAEHHLKDIPVRQAMHGFVPSAGVGTAFARDAFDEVARAHGQKPFNTESLTEDYEIGLKFRLAGRKTLFAVRSLQREVEVPRRFGKGTKKRLEEEYIATREYFPDALGASVRQRSRWILGITLQTWSQVGWRGALPVLYSLWRDRKTLLTNGLVLLAYLMLAYVGARTALSALGGPAWSLSETIVPGSALWLVLTANLGFFLWRGFMKALLVGRLYGTAHAFLSGPRLVLGNLVSLLATARATGTFAKHRVTGAPLRWLKTTHAFPSAAVLRAQRRRLGEFLLEAQGVSADDLEEALALQRATRLPLGEVLTAAGLASSRAVVRALGDQAELPVAELDEARIPAALLGRLPESEAESLEALPLGTDADGRVQVAFTAPPDPQALRRLEERLGAPVVAALAPAEALRRTRVRAYRRLARGETPARPRLGEALVAAGALGDAELRRVLEEQTETGERLAELLVRKGLVSPERIADALGGPIPYRKVRPEDVDHAALRRLGYGLCAFHGLVPLRPEATGGRTFVASPFPLHAAVLKQVFARLGRLFQPVLAPALEVRVALAVATRAVWPRGIHAGFGGLEGAELEALADQGALTVEAGLLVREARARGMSPIEHLETLGRIDPLTAARARARALGLEVAPDRALVPAGGLLPPALADEQPIAVHDAGPRSLVLSTERPRPDLAREVAALFPDHTIAWQIARGRPLPLSGGPHANA